MERLRCAILDDYQNVALSIADWGAIADRVDVISINRHLSDDELVSIVFDCAILVAMRERTPFHATLLERLPNLRLLVTSGMRNASIDIAAAAERQVTVCGTKSFSHPPAELTWALIFALSRNLHIEADNMRENRWQGTLGKDLAGSTIGLVGLGKIGQQIALVANALGMNVMSWSPNLTEERAARYQTTLVAKEQLFSTSDIVSLHLVLSSRTVGIIGRTELGLMKRGSLFINTSRAGLVDNSALYELLCGKRISAGLDVFDQEPLPPDDPFRNLPNVIATPHLGYVTERNYSAYYGEAVEDIHAFLASKPMRVLS
ncbi:D-2-hydroxyacid dehydrogenase family protein [Ensifer adhaerens]|uniref:D-2-hydroxyacid dehydrogenase family protein n=1 Tax=Ensifer adhaerens TaxID=106592 RepID=UPI003CFF0213